MVRSILKEERTKRKRMKIYLTLQVRFTKSRGDQVEVAEPHFHGRCHIVLNNQDIEHALRESIMKMVNSFVEYQREGSNWTLDKVLGININIVTYSPLKGSSYLPLPAKLARKKAIVNVQNTDDKCFMWSVLAALHPTTGHHGHPNRVNNYIAYQAELNFTDISFPVKVADISKFEKQNDISINVFGFEKEVYPLHLTKERGVRHVDLLILHRGDTSHYCWIKNFNRLMGDQTSHDHQYFYCHYCLHGFTKEKLLKKHLPYCQIHGAQRTEMPSEEEKWLKFSDVSKQLRVPIVVYADFECLLERQYGCQPDPSKSSTIKLAKHVPSGFTYKVVGLSQETTENHVTYRGHDAVNVFIDHMVKLEDEITRVIRNPKPMDLSETEKKAFQEATLCHICHGELGNDTVRDHCHVTGKFRGAAHSSCNLNFRLRERIPVFFHNLKGYDAHHMNAIGRFKHRKINCIPQNHEKYISFSLGRLDFVDTFQFMSTSLDKLSTNLAKEGIHKFPHLQGYVASTHPGNQETKLQLLSRKGVYPYRYMNSTKRFEETSLPPQRVFYNDLDGKIVSDQDYVHAQRVWDIFSIQNLGQYHDLYMETDVHLLADVFENFRCLCLEMYGLDAAHFYTAPGLAWQAALKMTDVNLELFTDPDMHLFVEKGLRGGIAMISKRYAKANNPHLNDYDPEQPSNYLMYLDANNLYGWAMSQPLPTHDFCWLTPEEKENLDVNAISQDGDTGYVFEVDLNYPMTLHDSHSDYPLAPESFKIEPEMLSNYQKELLTKLGMKEGSSIKLVPNLFDKENYVVHYRNLQLYLALGMRLTKIHRVLSFKQSPWLKAYIDFNTSMRKEATNDFEKDFFKLMNNSVFGKTMENLRKRVDIQLIHHKKRLLKLSAKPGFKAFKIFNEDLASVELVKSKLILNRPIYVGFSILELSKVLMYDFHYNYIKKKYGDHAALCFTDTDSLCYDISTEDVYDDMQKDQQYFDFSDYPNTHFLHSNVNKKVLGKMKDECQGHVMREFVGLKPKMYSFTFEKKVIEEDKQVYLREEQKRAKGVSRTVVQSNIQHENYRTCLFNKESQMERMVTFRSYHHQVHTIVLNKTTLSPFDDKRHILDDGIHSLAHGHCKI
jgi:hypothetical protein